MSKLGVALIGSGIFIKEEHLPAVQKCPDLELKAIYSRSLKSAQSVSEGLSSVDLYSNDSQGKDYAALLQRSDVQAVIIALPILVQPDFIKQALKAGKHVLAEKPIAKDLATGKDLIDWYHAEIDTTKVNLSIAEQFRYLPAYIHAAKTIGSMGKVLGFRTRMHACIQPGSKYYETEWRKKPEYQGGFLLDGGVHFIAGIRAMLAGGGERVRDEFGDVGVGSGVKTEVFAWARSLGQGEWDPRQSAEEGLADLELLEAMVRSGEGDGKAVVMKYQT